MKFVYLRTDFPSGRSHILMREIGKKYTELRHYLLVLSNNGKLWVDVFWPENEDYEKYTRELSERQFWHTFREWRLQGLVLGDNEKVAYIWAKKHLAKKINKTSI